MSDSENRMGCGLPQNEEEYAGKCSNCGKDCIELFSGQCDTCFLEEQYYGGGTVFMYDPNPGEED